MKDRLKNLINKIEVLELDTQPIRDLLNVSEDDIKTVNSKITNLEREVNKHSPGSRPQQVQLMLNHLKLRPKEATFKGSKVNIEAQNYIVQRHEKSADPKIINAIEQLGSIAQKLTQVANNTNTTTPASIVMDERVLEKLEQLGKKVDNIKLGSTVGATDPEMPTIKEGFVSPIDEEEVKKIKGTVNVVPKKGRSLKSSLDKLKGLK